MATPIWHGTNLAGYLLEGVDATIELNDFGIASASLTYTSKWAGAVGLVAGIVRHPTYPFLVRKSANITREEADSAKIVIKFEGIPPEVVEASKKYYSVDVTTATEPIESHPDFKDKIGGTPAAPLFNAEFDEKGKFKGFPVVLEDGTTDNPKAGMKSYLAPGVIYQEEYLADSIGAVLDDVGKIDTPPSSILKPAAPGRTWLFIGGSARQSGDGIRVTRRWRLSGPRTWDTDVYKAS